MNILQQIFSDHYKEIKCTLNLRPATLENIEKMIHCGDPSFGGAMYGCSSSSALKFVPFRCKSRFCPSCGTLYSIHRTTSMSLNLIQCVHRHCVFTIPEELRIFFRRDRSLLNCLFYSVRDVILRMFRKFIKSERFTPGLYALDAVNTRCKDDAMLFLVGDQIMLVIFQDHRIRRNSINISIALWYGFHIRHTEIDHLILYFPTRNDGAVQIIRCIHVIMLRVQFWGCKINSFVVAYEIVCIEWVFYACSTTC